MGNDIQIAIVFRDIKIDICEMIGDSKEVHNQYQL